MTLKIFCTSFLVILFSIGCMGGDRFTPNGWSGLTLDEGVLYVSAGDGKLKALDSQNGSVIWSFPDADSGLPSLGQFYGPPEVAGENLYVASYETDGKRCGGSGKSGTSPCGRVYRLEIKNKDGSAWVRRSWIFPRLDLPAVGSFVGKPVLAGDSIVVGSSDGNVYAVGAETGDRLWEFTTNAKVWSTPTIVDGSVFFGSMDHTLYAVSLETGNLLWSFEAQGAITSRPLVVNGKVYFGSFDHHVYALDAQSGILVWKFIVDQWIWADPVTDGQALFVGALSGSVYALDLDSGRSKWLAPGSTVGSIVAAPVLVEDYVVVVTDEGFLSAFRTDDGGKEWGASLESPVRASPVVSGEILFLIYEDGLVGPINVANRDLYGDPTLWEKVKVVEQ